MRTDNSSVRASASRHPFRLKRRAEERVMLLGQEMDLVKPEEVLQFIANHVIEGKRAIIANHNAHSLYLIQKNIDFQRFYARADLIEVDSVPLLLLARITGRKSSRTFHRCTYLDWRDKFWRLVAQRRWKVFYLGGGLGVAAKAAERIRAGFPGSTIEVHHGHFDVTAGSSDNADVLAAISGFGPHILMVGMGMPRQEEWIIRNYDLLNDCVVLPVGAAFDYEAGVQKAAPRWVGRFGIEWLYRLVSDPRRLFRRYCIEPWALLTLVARDWRAARAHRLSASVPDRRTQTTPPAGLKRRRVADLRGLVDAAAYPPELVHVPEVSEPDGSR